MSMTIRIDGAKEVIARLSGLTVALQKRILNKVGRRVLKPVVASARKNVPEDTGNLKKSLGVKRVKRARKGEFVFLVGARPGFKWGDPVTQTEHDPMRYAVAVEYGHVLKVFGRPTGVFIAPAGFLRAAYLEHRVKVAEDFGKEVMAEIDAQLRRGA